MVFDPDRYEEICVGHSSSSKGSYRLKSRPDVRELNDAEILEVIVESESNYSILATFGVADSRNSHIHGDFGPYADEHINSLGAYILDLDSEAGVLTAYKRSEDSARNLDHWQTHLDEGNYSDKVEVDYSGDIDGRVFIGGTTLDGKSEIHFMGEKPDNQELEVIVRELTPEMLEPRGDST